MHILRTSNVILKRPTDIKSFEQKYFGVNYKLQCTKMEEITGNHFSQVCKILLVKKMIR